MNIKNIICTFLLLHLSSFGVGREILNFYLEEPKNNLYQSYGELENKDGKKYYKWKIGTGTSKLNDNWTFDYDIEKKYDKNSNSDIGLGGAYWGFDFFLSSIDTNSRDGYSLEGNLTGSINLGYGFQNFFTIYNEYLDYGNNRGTYLFRIENNFRWTYDLNENFAFSLDSEIDSYNYYKNTDQDKSFKFNVGPYLLYS